MRKQTCGTKLEKSRAGHEKSCLNKEGEKPEMETSAVIIDDHANELKDKGIQKALNKMLIKARHLNTSFIFTLQSYLYFPKTLRKQITFATIFKPRNSEEWESIRKEILQMNEGDGVILGWRRDRLAALSVALPCGYCGSGELGAALLPVVGQASVGVDRGRC